VNGREQSISRYYRSVSRVYLSERTRSPFPTEAGQPETFFSAATNRNGLRSSGKRETRFTGQCSNSDQCDHWRREWDSSLDHPTRVIPLRLMVFRRKPRAGGCMSPRRRTAATSGLETYRPSSPVWQPLIAPVFTGVSCTSAFAPFDRFWLQNRTVSIELQYRKSVCLSGRCSDQNEVPPSARRLNS
jgi:hypothetical protein